MKLQQLDGTSLKMNWAERCSPGASQSTTLAITIRCNYEVGDENLFSSEEASK